MQLDKTFKRELKQLGNTPQFRSTARKCAQDLSTPDNMHGNYENCIRKYGRATVAVCTAATMIPCYELSDKDWAKAVCESWRGDISGLAFNDGLNVTRIMGYTQSLRNMTTVTA